MRWTRCWQGWRAAVRKLRNRPVDNTVSLQAAGRVLVAEDNAVNQMVMKGLLGLLGLEHDIVPDGVTALEKFDAEPAGTYGLVLMDLRMPLLDGFDTARMIREREAGEGLPRVPIVAVSASEATTARDRAQRSGIDGYLAKPVSRESLTAMIERVMGAATAIQPENAHAEPLLDGFGLRVAELMNIGGSALAREALDAFATHSGELLARLAHALERGDASAALEASHSLKGSCLAIGADELSRHAAGIEHRAGKRDLTGLREALTTMESELQVVLAAIAELATASAN